MNKKSLQEIEDYYRNLGYKEEKLRNIIKKDRQYQKLLQERKQKLTTQFQINSHEKKKYVLSTDSDFEILKSCKILENKKLTEHDKVLVKLIKAQLENDWREYLLTKLTELLTKYK